MDQTLVYSYYHQKRSESFQQFKCEFPVSNLNFGPHCAPHLAGCMIAVPAAHSAKAIYLLNFFSSLPNT